MSDEDTTNKHSFKKVKTYKKIENKYIYQNVYISVCIFQGSTLLLVRNQ